MSCKSIPIEPNPRGFKYVSEEYLKDWHKDQTASRWTYDKPDQLDQILPWPEIKGMDTSAVDVINDKIRPHRFQRYSDGWARIAKERVGSEAWLLHVNTNGFYVSEKDMWLGIPTLLVKILHEIDIQEFEDVAIYKVNSDSKCLGPMMVGQSKMPYNINIIGHSSFKPAMDKLASAAAYSFNEWRGRKNASK